MINLIEFIKWLNVSKEKNLLNNKKILNFYKRIDRYTFFFI